MDRWGCVAGRLVQRRTEFIRLQLIMSAARFTACLALELNGMNSVLRPGKLPWTGTKGMIGIQQSRKRPQRERQGDQQR